MAHGVASTSQPAVLKWRGAPARRRPRAPPRRVTNTQKEIWDHDDELREMAKGIDADAREYINVSDAPVWDPEKGPLHGRINRTVLEEQQSDEISVLETAYWFHTPPGGWRIDVKTPVAEECEPDFPQPEHLGEEDKACRFPLEALEGHEGLEVEGVVTDVWLYHGAQVDFMGEFDGLIRVSQEEWKQEAVAEALLPGNMVKVKIHKVSRRGLYRWPVQLELLDDKIAALITRPDEWTTPADLKWAFDQGWDLDQVASALGRTYRKASYMLEPDMAMVAEHQNWKYGWDEPDINGEAVDWITKELDVATNLDISDAAASAVTRD